MKQLYLLLLLVLITACDKEVDAMNAYTFYQECAESKTVDFSTITSQSTCNGVNLILAMYLDDETISSKGINYILFTVFKNKKGKLDWVAMENFREPGSGQTLGHIMAEYGGYAEIEQLFKRYSTSNLIYLQDRNGENVFHKLARNRMNNFHLRKYCDAAPSMRALAHQKNSFDMTSIELAASKGEFSKALSFYGCSRKKEGMASLFAEYGVELAFTAEVVQYPELFDYMAPYLMEEREVEPYFGAKIQRLSLFELHKYSSAFARFIMQDEVVYNRFMTDPEIMSRMVAASNPDTFGNRDSYGHSTIFYYAASDLDDRGLYKQIMEKSNLSLVNLRGETVFHVLARNDKRKELKLALRKLASKSSLLIRDLNGKTALDVCVGETCKILKRATPAL